MGKHSIDFTVVGRDLAKHVFQVHAVEPFRNKLRRSCAAVSTPGSLMRGHGRLEFPHAREINTHPCRRRDPHLELRAALEE